MTTQSFNGCSPFYISEIKQWKKDSRRSIKEYRSKRWHNTLTYRAGAAMGRTIKWIGRATAHVVTFSIAVIAYPFYRMLKRNSRAISFMLAAVALPLLVPITFT